MRKHFISQNAVNYLKVFTMESNNVNPHKTEAVKIHCLRSASIELYSVHNFTLSEACEFSSSSILYTLFRRFNITIIVWRSGKDFFCPTSVLAI